MPKIVDADARRDELARAAARVIGRVGLNGASMREVAAEAGWTTGTLVHYFKDKRELLRMTLEGSIEQRTTRRDSRSAMDPQEALVDTLRGALVLDDQSRQFWVVTIAFSTQATGDPELALILRDAYRSFRSQVARLVEASDSSPDPQTEAERLIAVVDGIAIQALFDPESWPPKRQLAALDSELASATVA